MAGEIVSLCEAYESFFPIGSAVSARSIRTHRDLLLKHFSSITPSNEMKFSSVHPTESAFQFLFSDSIADFAQANGMLLRGHVLVWHQQTPQWVFEQADGSPASRDLLLDRMREHIHTLVSRYRGKAYCWDVLNEAVDDKGTDYLRRTKWLEIIGPDYIEKAFQYAHDADPDALLFYNDYNEVAPEKRKKIIRLVTELRAKDVPIHGIGLQGHWSIHSPSIDAIDEALEEYASLGLPLQITELDISVFSFADLRTDLMAPTDEMMKLQAEKYEKVFELFRRYRDVITGVTLWGTADDHSWRHNFPVRGRRDWPLLFDFDHQPKESFFRVVNF